MFEQYEKKVYSQNGEDGVLEQIFKRRKVNFGTYVEIGAENGSECNTRNLRENHGWGGILFDAYQFNPARYLFRERFGIDNINSLFEKYNIPPRFDLLSIDVDFNDFYLWAALDRKYTPEVVVIEYNSSIGGKDLDKVVIYDSKYKWDGSNYFGASFKALCLLGEAKGYKLIYAEKTGVNLFFIKHEHALNFNPEMAVEKIYRPPAYGENGHPPDKLKREYLPYERAIKVLSKVTRTAELKG